MIKYLQSRPWVCASCLRQAGKARPQQRWLSVASGAAQAGPAPAPVDSATSEKHDDSLLRRIFDSPNDWQAFSRPSSTASQRAGLFRNAYLTKPEGFRIFAQANLMKAQKIVEKVLNASSVEEYRAIVRDLDRLSDLLCRVIDLSDFVRVTHPDMRTQQAAAEAWAIVYQYMNQLNTTTGLNEQLGKALANLDVVSSWTEEEKTVAEILKLDFSKSAVNLPQESRDKFVELSQQISEVGSAFVDEMAPAQYYLELPGNTNLGADVPKRMSLTKGSVIKLPTMSSQAQKALRSVPDENVRKLIYYGTRTASHRSVKMLEILMKLRAELAQLAGFESYGHMALRDRMMAKSPESVKQFLQALAKNNGAIVQQEMADLLKEKRRRNTSNPEAAGSLQAWDKDYYMALVRGSMDQRFRHERMLSSFFSLGSVMQGLSRLFNRLYGLRLVPRETLPGETWHPDVRRLDVVSDTDGHVAVLYCDLFYREDKSPNPAHFTIRCSREISGYEIEEAAQEGEINPNLPSFESPAEAANDGMALSSQGGTVKQLPTIALVCDFVQGSGDIRALLSFHQLETLFHEMGHAVHSVLARTSLQNVAGTRCATDLAELPSTLMEHFAADPSVLALFARHHETGEPLDYEMVAERLRMAKRFEGCDDENQIILAMLDQEYHSARAARQSFDTTAIYHELQRTHGNLPPDPPGTAWQGFFGHLFGYGSTYYSYLFDRVLAERVWKEVFRSGRDRAAVSRENGEHFKDSLLKWGGSREPWRCVSDALRDERIAHGDERAMALVGSWGTSSGVKE
ncbi:uncharacterized protein E0L32_001071 [Thyridium curvatum]|uniref:Mitochondrial intermediate peptidase n=1 Tax=Thyridium curvatum TaxID=1093900 RepID=A0A507AU37_9PEZI|nr:uncharacterized protein E0L32_001071 [Thyridium curvatum]TPX11253.1 hypothetical protein E0L32_001071 [Thyridium curvatum]